MEKKRTLYLECRSGISGDMTVAALLDLGATEENLRNTLAQLHLEGYKIRIGRVQKSGVDACDFHVILEEEQSHTHHHHTHEHRTWKDIEHMLDNAGLKPRVLELSKEMFRIVADAEGKVHGRPREEVHFHEVGAVDSIVDIVAAAVCLDNLDIQEVIVPMLCEGTGTVWCQHGILPVPVPAVANIMESHKLPVRIVDAEGEFVTPTGAAIVAAVRTSETLPRDFAVEKVGIGAGKRSYERPGILRAMMIRDRTGSQDVICKLY